MFAAPRVLLLIALGLLAWADGQLFQDEPFAVWEPEASFLDQIERNSKHLDSACPSCARLFEGIRGGGAMGRRGVMRVEVQQRGEPKSGTRYMFEWATSSLMHVRYAVVPTGFFGMRAANSCCGIRDASTKPAWEGRGVHDVYSGVRR